MKNKFALFCSRLLLTLFLQISLAQTTSLISVDSNGKLIYIPDSKGNIVPDFSGVGYMNSESPIPTVVVVKTINPVLGDNLANIQNAINEVSVLTPDANGFRGAILFKAGTYNISNSITISVSGIVLRGEGFDGSGTNFIATKTSQHNLINFVGASGTSVISSSTKAITNAYLPIGTKQVSVASGHTFGVGDAVFVHRIPNDTWINLLGMNLLTSYDPLATNWVASSYDLYSQRKVTAVNGNLITSDATIMDIFDPLYFHGN